ncbi:MarR family winged helix-turn-helix transcriptional regulator [Plantactinospora sp. BC1]|uniref:MarR family winged helix-turn-helix transcriptional regulator n=1 Tax=Plantactinospora sp. BC1 TaxID=2108470 RepID=UPI00131EDA48|nr:MarR family transcriptional regulator [Plantactinospora sp. BC1]
MEPAVPACDDFPDPMERIFAFAVTVSAYMQAGLVAKGLSRARATVIWQLHRHGPSTQRQLAQTIGVTARNITTLVDALEESGFVHRRAHPTDRRAILVGLTEAGTAVTEQLDTDYQTAATYLFAGLEPQQVTDFVAILDLLTTRLTPTPQNGQQPGQ